MYFRGETLAGFNCTQQSSKRGRDKSLSKSEEATRAFYEIQKILFLFTSPSITADDKVRKICRCVFYSLSERDTRGRVVALESVL